MKNWKSDKAWSDRFIPAIKRILGEHLIAEADVAEDTFRNTDLITLRLAGEVRIACRVRQHAYLRLYGDEFTLRCSRPSGAATEIDKLLAGWGDYLFYGFANQDGTALAAWFLGDLDVFRRWVRWYQATRHDWPGELKENLDGSSRFVVFRIADVFPDFIVARSPHEH